MLLHSYAFSGDFSCCLKLHSKTESVTSGVSVLSCQLFLVSNGGKFVKKTLIGEAYVWLDKVDLRKRVVSWHKLLASTAQIHS